MQFPSYDADRDAVINRMRAAEIKTITVGTDIQTSQAAIALAESYPRVLWATIGVHPTSDFRCQISDFRKLRALAAHPKVVAVGECGLDYYRLQSARREEQIARQKELFLQQIEIARAVNKPLMIHCRPSKGTNDAYEDLINILTLNFQFLTLHPIIHFFVGSPAVAKQLLALGAYFSFGGVITFARDYDAVIRSIPLERIVLETDAPYVTPLPYRGTRNEPSYIVEVAQKMAAIKIVDYVLVCAMTEETTRNILGISKGI